MNGNKYISMKPSETKDEILRSLIRHSKNGFLWNKLIRRDLLVQNNVHCIENVNFTKIIL